jgi:glycosyltransferase involved in cell wall biosynthesis
MIATTGIDKGADTGPTVSAVIPAHNAAGTIARALQSVFTQTRIPDEIIVVDDCSTDRTCEIVCSFLQRGVTLLSTEHRKGAGAARNRGMAAATGDLVAFLDADDQWLPSKTEKQLAMMVSDQRLAFVSCGANSISPNGTDLGDTYGRARVAAGSEAWKALLACNFIATPSVMTWRRALERMNGFDEAMKIGEDQDMWIRLALAGSLGYVPESLVRVHLHDDSLSSWALDDLLIYTLPMIERHIREQADRLSEREIRRILGERLNRFGRVAYVRGEVRRGVRLILRSLRLGYRPADSFLYLANAAPPVVWAKRQLARTQDA